MYTWYSLCQKFTCGLSVNAICIANLKYVNVFYIVYAIVYFWRKIENRDFYGIGPTMTSLEVSNFVSFSHNDNRRYRFGLA